MHTRSETTGTARGGEATAIGHATSADGTRIGFTISGDGPPLVLVHGTSGDHTRWESIQPALEERFTVYALDRRGRGLSGDAATYAIAREFEDVAAVIDSIGGPVDVLGHSYGALCAMEAALLTPHVGRLVLYEPPLRTGEPIYEHGQRERLEEMLERGQREEVLTTFFSEVVGMSEAELALMRGAPGWSGRLAAAHTIPREFADGDHVLDPTRFEGLTAPVLLLAGSESAPFLRAATEAAREALP
ncbi:MAG: alpha/beta hydrolase, partial [Dehalococcoidia bacterium]